ncbi:gp16 family protein [Rhizobium ruizarguesonis]
MSASIAAIHVAKKQLGLDDDTYRAKLARITGKSSAKEMTEAERLQVLTVFRNEGFAPAPAARRADGRQKLTGKYAKKLQALWIGAWNLGIVRDRDDKALIAFVKRQTGIDHTRFVVFPDDANRAIEALKKWMSRVGGVDWSDSPHLPTYMRRDGYRIASAQHAILDPMGGAVFWALAADLTGQDRAYRDFTDDQWISIMNHFGNHIRSK